MKVRHIKRQCQHIGVAYLRGRHVTFIIRGTTRYEHKRRVSVTEIYHGGARHNWRL